MRREREIRNQQLLEVSQCLPPSFLHVCLDLVVSFTQKTVLLFYLGYLRFFVFCPPVVRVACSLCVPYLYIYTYIYYLRIYIYTHLSIYILYTTFFNEYSCIEKLSSYTIYTSNEPLTFNVPEYTRHP